MIVYLVEALPVAKVGGAQVVLRYSSAPQRYRPNGFDWKARLAVPFRRAFQAFDGTFSDQPASFGSFEVRMGTGDLVSPVSGLAWDGRRVRIWRGAPGLDTDNMELVFDGEAQSVSATKQGFSVELRGPGYPLTKNALALYLGNGGAEGTGDLAATPKPLVLGKVTNASPVYLDRTKNIFQYHAYGAGSLQGVFDGGSALTFSGNNYATYAQLDAAAVPGGQYSTCDAIGAAKHGGTAISVLTVDATATATASGTIASILTWVAGQAGVTIDAATMAWFDANLSHPQDNYVTDQTSWEAIVKDMLLKLGGYLWWTPDGRMSAGLVRRGAAPSIQLGRTNLGEVKVNPTSPPYFRRRMGYQRSWRVQTYAETRTPREVNPRGTYAAGLAYAYYDLVNYGIDTWLHIGADPTTGIAPAEGAVWTKFGVGATKTSQLTDDAGLGLTATWPSVGGTGKPADYADVTASNTASAIINQGAFATKNSAAYGSTLLTGFGSLSPMNSLFFGSSALTETNGGLAATLNAFKTALGIASGFTGQGALASLSSLAYGGNFLTGFGALSPLDSLFFGSSALTETNGGTAASLNNFKTALGIASGIASQGSLATLSSLANGSSYLTGFGGLSSLSNVFFGSPQLLEASAGAQATLANFKTSSGTAAAIAGQGSFATVSSAAYGSSLLTGFGALAPLGNLFFGSSLLQENNGGPAATLANFKTSAGTAAGITGQGPWATTPTPTERVLGQNSNLIYNGAFTLRGARWALGSGWGVYSGSQGEGNYAARNVSGLSVSYSDFFNCDAGFSGYAQAEMFSGGLTAGGFKFDIEFFNGGTFLSSSAAVGAAPGAGWTEAGTPFTAPANTTRARFRFFHEANAQNTSSAIRKIKVSGASTRISFTDEATSGSSYDDGTYLEVLKPGELGSNKTETRTAAAISGQSSWATYTGLATTTVEGRTQKLDGSGNLEAAGVFKSNFGWLDVYFPATTGSDKTSGGTAAGIAGQGAFATISSAAYGSSLLTGFGSLSSLSSLFFGSSQLQETSGGPSATLANFKTSAGTAAAIAGQGPWATTSTPTERVLGQNANLVYDGGFSLGGARWSLGAGWSVLVGSNAEGSYVGRSTGGLSVSYSDFFNIAPPISGYAQAEMFSAGLTAGGFYFDIEFFNGSTYLSRSPTVGLASPAGWTEVGTPFTVPANTTRARFRFYHDANAQNTNSAIRKIKVSGAATRISFTDEATNGALYADNTNLDALKPSELGSNKTETRTAAAISGQGSFATVSSAAYGSSLLTGFGSLAARGDVYFGNSMIKEASGGSTATLANFKTSSGTAAAIAGQSSWATYTGLSTQTVEGRTQRLQQDGYINATTIYQDNAGFLSNFFPGEGGSNKTETRTAAAITGQGPWATTTTPTERVLGQNANLIYNGGFRLKGARWALGPGWIIVEGSYGEGNYAARTQGGLSVSYSDFFNCAPSLSGYLQAEMFSGGLTAGGFKFDIEFFNGGTFLSSSAAPAAPPGSGWSEQGAPFFSPAGTTRARLRFFHEANAQNTNSAIRKIKVSGASTRVSFTDDATSGASYDDGTYLEVLKPGEAASNRTETRTAAAISGQSSWATYTGLSTQTVEGRTQRLQSDGYVESSAVFKSNYGWLNDYFPATQGSDKTSSQTAAGISGQGAFATVSQIARSNVASYFDFNAFSLNYTVTRADGSSIVTESLAITSQGVSAGFSGQGSLATMSTIGTDQMNANSVTVPGYFTVDSGGSLNNYSTGVWQDFDTSTGGGSVGGGGGGGSGGGGWTPQMPQQ